ncbi:MAG: hypothetical protein QOH96_1428, partial [Blastocatellia bacterium]|nr:hypothetical protein [Blastocatellia bacterium]
MLKIRFNLVLIAVVLAVFSIGANAQTKGQDPSQESERSDKFTGGKIETGVL